jgi:type II secretory pathway component PulM
MIDWFRQREPREQLVLGIGATLAIVIVGWNFVWLPLRDGASELNATVAERSRQLVDLHRAAGLSASTAVQANADAPSLLPLVDETARKLGLVFERQNPDGPDAITVSFRDARFDRLIGWLIDLEQTYGLAAVNVSFTQSGGQGLVSGQIRLER